MSGRELMNRIRDRYRHVIFLYVDMYIQKHFLAPNVIVSHIFKVISKQNPKTIYVNYSKLGYSDLYHVSS